MSNAALAFGARDLVSNNSVPPHCSDARSSFARR
jgi:hypothetical protein